MNNDKKHSCNCNHDHEHNHEEEHDCGCEGGCDSNEEVEMIYLTLEDGKELACEILATFEIEKKEYIALLPTEEEDVFLYGYEESEEGPILSEIETDEEYKNVSEAFLSLCE
ncbi:DUF1292 domain-containing protein [Lutibacter sp. B2]|nr:DUF1292 domain-containing protein [Lutibacter sp. B2]